MLERFFLKRQRKDYHKSVKTLSIGSWWDVQETSDFSHLLNTDNWLNKFFYSFRKVRKDQSPKSALVWEEIQDSYIQLIGFGEMASELNDLKLKLHGHICDSVDNPFSDNWVLITHRKIEELEKEIQDKSKTTNEEILNTLEDWKGRDVDVYKVSVKRFYDSMDYYCKKAKEQARKAA